MKIGPRVSKHGMIHPEFDMRIKLDEENKEWKIFPPEVLYRDKEGMKFKLPSKCFKIKILDEITSEDINGNDLNLLKRYDNYMKVVYHEKELYYLIVQEKIFLIINLGNFEALLFLLFDQYIEYEDLDFLVYYLGARDYGISPTKDSGIMLDNESYMIDSLRISLEFEVGCNPFMDML